MVEIGFKNTIFLPSSFNGNEFRKSYKDVFEFYDLCLVPLTDFRKDREQAESKCTNGDMQMIQPQDPINNRLIKDYKEISDSFIKIKKDPGSIFIPPFSGLNSPYLRPDIKAAILNITLDTNKHDFIKSLMHGIAMRSSEVVLALEKVSNISVKKVIADGGASQNNEYLQLLADFSGKKIIRPKNLNGTAYGTFMLAKLIYQKKDIIKYWKQPETDRVFYPEKTHEEFKNEWEKHMENLLRT